MCAKKKKGHKISASKIPEKKPEIRKARYNPVQKTIEFELNGDIYSSSVMSTTNDSLFNCYCGMMGMPKHFQELDDYFNNLDKRFSNIQAAMDKKINSLLKDFDKKYGF